MSDTEPKYGQAGTVKSFAELSTAETVLPSDFVATYVDYATSGSAISGATTVEVFNRVREQLSDEQLQQVVDSSFIGAMNQDRHAKPVLRPVIDAVSVADRSIHGTVNQLGDVVNYVRVGRIANDVLVSRKNPSHTA